MSLEEVRKRIDEIDKELVGLLDRRAAAGREAARLKILNCQPLRNVGRENEVVAKVTGLSNGSMPRRSLEKIYRAIMAETLAQETNQDAHPGHENGSACNKARQDIRAEVVENAPAASGFRRMRLYAPALGCMFAPGQFFQIRVEGGNGIFLRRPFAPSEFHDDGITFVYAVVGAGTEAMAALPVGAAVQVLAPLGNAYALPPVATDVLLIGGGCGAPSLAPLAKQLKSGGNRVTALIGARTAEMLLEHEMFARLVDRLIVATDDGSRGCHGNVVEAFRRENVGAPSRMYACGPKPMLKAAAKLAEELGIECQVSLEERMACGFGACMGCAVPVKDDKAEGGIVYRRVCHEGPVFDARKLAWDKM